MTDFELQCSTKPAPENKNPLDAQLTAPSFSTKRPPAPPLTFTTGAPRAAPFSARRVTGNTRKVVNSVVRIFAAMSFVLATGAVQADNWLIPDEIGILGFSYHGIRDGYFATSGERRPWNELNPGILLRYNVDPIHTCTFAIFENSFDNVGATFTIDQTWIRGDNWSAGLFLGLSHYPEFGTFQPSNLGFIDPALEDIFIIAGFQARYGNIFINHVPGHDNLTSITVVGLAFDIP